MNFKHTVFFFLAVATATGGLADPVVIATIPVDPNPDCVGVNPVTDLIYVSTRAFEKVAVIDGEENAVPMTVPVGDRPVGVDTNPITNRVYVANRDEDSVSVIDGTTNTVIATIPVGNGPGGGIAVNSVTNRIYVANVWSWDVTVIDGYSNTVVASIYVGGRPVGLAVNSSTNLVYVARRFRQDCVLIDGATDAIVTHIPLGGNAAYIAVNPDTNRIYVTTTTGVPAVWVIDGATHAVVDNIAVPTGYPHHITVIPGTNRLYFTNTPNDEVWVVDLESNAVLGTVAVGDQPLGIRANEETYRIYVANFSDSTVTVIEDMVILTVSIDIKPGSDPNCFNINGHGVIPVAINGSAAFDVYDIDVGTLIFDGLQVRVRGNKGPLCSIEYSNSDGYLDMVCHFEDDPGSWTGGDSTATVTGSLLDGTAIEGTDSICIVP